MAEPFIGEIMIFAGNFAPRGWALCQGQLLSISQNAALFSILGTTYGGDGITNFALPDLRGRYPRGVGQGPSLSNVVEGEMSGAETVTLNLNEIPAHTHTATENVSNAVGTVGAPNGGFLAKDPTGGSVPMYNSTPTSGKSLNAGAITVGSAGGSQPHSVLDPYLGLNYCIALVGIFPSRN
jgi:microcystin-dependent protein